MVRVPFAGGASWYRASLVAVGLVLAFEAVGVALLVGHFVHNGAVKLAVIVVHSVVMVTMGLALVAPLHTPHEVDGTSLRLRWGVQLDARIPLAAIERAERVDESRAPLGLSFDATDERACVLLGTGGRVLLTLREPVAVRMRPQRRRNVRRILVNADDADALLRALTT